VPGVRFKMKILILSCLIAVSSRVLAHDCNVLEQPSAGGKTVEKSSDAQLLALREYILTKSGDSAAPPQLVSFGEGVKGFAKPGEEVWEVRIINPKTGLKAAVFVHPDTKEAYIPCLPYDWAKSNCDLRGGEK